MLLKEFYIDKFIQRIKDAERISLTEIDEAFNAGLNKAIHILEQIKEESHDAPQQ